MNEPEPNGNAPTARLIALAALLTGFAGDLLLRWIPWGAGAALWTLLILTTTGYLFHRLRPQRVADLLLPFTGALIAATGLVWRDSDLLTFLNVCLLLASLALLCLGPQGVAAWNAGITRVLTALLKTVGQALAGFFKLLFDQLEWRALLSSTPGRSGSLIRGGLIALPALLIFGSLLASADVAFAKLVKDLIVIDIADLFQHLLLIAWITAICLGFYYALTRGERGEGFGRPAFLQLGAGDVAIALILIDVMFAAFVGVQFRYLFGGADLVRIAPNLTRSEYARSGFFQLVWVVMLVVPMLLVAEWIIDKSRPAAVRLFRGAALLQVALVLDHRRLGMAADGALSRGVRADRAPALYDRVHDLARRAPGVAGVDGAHGQPRALLHRHGCQRTDRDLRSARDQSRRHDRPHERRAFVDERARVRFRLRVPVER
jgi:hypothetical protein